MPEKTPDDLTESLHRLARMKYALSIAMEAVGHASEALHEVAASKGAVHPYAVAVDDDGRAYIKPLAPSGE